MQVRVRVRVRVGLGAKGTVGVFGASPALAATQSGHFMLPGSEKLVSRPFLGKG